MVKYRLALLCLLTSTFAANGNTLTGYYYGTASIDQPAGLGTVDLAFYLDVSDGVIQQSTSYIDLEKTLLFPAVAQIDGKDVGPRADNESSFDLESFQLTTEEFTSTVDGLADPVTRQIVLNADAVNNGGASISGTYTETVTGLTREPLTISGSFLLISPQPVTLDSGKDLNGDGCLNLEEIRMGGSDSTKVEFSDISAAMNLYNAPTATLRLGNPPGPTCADDTSIIQSALEEYYGERQ
jgi:hypothetical protein